MTDASPTLSLALAQALTLGEGVQWHPPSGRWWWVDIEGCSLYAWTPGAAALLHLRLPERVGCFAHTQSGALLLGMAKRVARLEWADWQACGEHAVQPQTLVAVEADVPTTRVNDGRCDRQGRFVFGTLDEDRPRQPRGGFYQYSSDHGLRRLNLGGVRIANSICFSPDGQLLYWCDTLTRCIMVVDYDSARAAVGEPRVFVRKELDHCWPDGSVVDATGCLWNAEWGHGSVARYAPDGQLLARWQLPVPHSSCPALGGPAGDQLVVTTAREELSAEQLARAPDSGSLFACTVPKGLYLPETLFADR